MSKIQITKTHTIDRTTSVHDDKAIRCGKDCFHCSRQYRECDLFPFSKREYHQSDNAWSPCQACLDAERKADEQKGYSEFMAVLVKENDELTENLQLAKECIQAQITYKLSSYSLQSVVNKLEQVLAKHKETKG